MKELAIYKNSIITDKEIKDILHRLGVNFGDDICVHSEIYRFGKPLVKRELFFESIIRALEEVVLPQGTLIMPAFSYSFCNGEPYDVLNTPSKVGALTEEFRKKSGIKRTQHPIFSFSVHGKNEKEYLNTGDDAFSHDSVYGKLIDNNGKVVFLGANKGYTIYHLAEEKVGVLHRFFKSFAGTIIDYNGKSVQKTIPYYVRHLDMVSEANEKRIEEFLLEEGLQKQESFQRGTISVIDAKSSYEAFVDKLRKEPEYFIGE